MEFRFLGRSLRGTAQTLKDGGLYAESIVQEHLPVEGQFFTHYMKTASSGSFVLGSHVECWACSLRSRRKSFLMRGALAIGANGGSGDRPLYVMDAGAGDVVLLRA